MISRDTGFGEALDLIHVLYVAAFIKIDPSFCTRHGSACTFSIKEIREEGKHIRQKELRKEVRE